MEKTSNNGISHAPSVFALCGENADAGHDPNADGKPPYGDSGNRSGSDEKVGTEGKDFFSPNAACADRPARYAGRRGMAERDDGSNQTNEDLNKKSEDGWDDDRLVRQVIPLLIAWYRKNRKDLPWRREPTPYHVWISEIMLQQTRIEAALSYYSRFLEELPDVASLAAVSDDRLMKLWQGLGYYSRARNLKKAAVLVTEKYGGNLPQKAAELRLLPGIGEYTAGAIASIAYGEPEPAVDGNVLRVLSRLLASWDDILLPAVRRRMTALLSQNYPSGNEAALLTEGLMELGEVVCVPNGEVRCALCPAAVLCRARKYGLTEKLPIRGSAKERRIEERTVLLLCSPSGRYAIAKRGKTGLLADMWEFPNLQGKLEENEVEDYLAEQNIQMRSLSRLGEGKHLFSHVEWRMRGYFVEVKNEGGSFVWKIAEEIRNEYAIPSAFRLFLRRLE